MTAWQGHILDCLVPEERTRAWRGVDSIIARGNGTGCDSPDPATRARLRRAGAEGRRISAIAVARYWRDARLTRIFEGTSEIQRRIIADGLLASAPLT